MEFLFCNLNDVDLVPFANCKYIFKHLESFSFQLYGNKISEKGHSSIMKLCKNFPSIKNLSFFNIGEFNTIGNSIIELKNHLLNLQNLQELYLDLDKQ